MTATAWVPTGESTSLGIAEADDLDDDPTFAAQARRFDWERAIQAVVRDNALQHASRRWRPGGDDPDVLVPGDLPIIRGIVAQAHLNEMQARLSGQHGQPGDSTMPVVLAAQVASLTEAVPFFLDGPTALGVLSSAPPDDDVVSSIRLPYPSVYVGFGRELEMPIDEMVWPDIFEDRTHGESTTFMWTAFSTLMETALLERGGAISGLVLLAGPDGVGLSDFVLWIVSSNPDPNHPDPRMRRDRQRSTIIGYRHRAIWRHIIDNAAAAVAWLDWQEPDPLDIPDVDDNVRWRKLSRTSQWRKREPRGAAGGVRTVSARHEASVRSDRPAAGERSSPRSHIRTGHWRSVRVATRNLNGEVVGDVRGEVGKDWHYEGRWIPPTVVNAAGTPDDRVVVYRIPVIRG